MLRDVFVAGLAAPGGEVEGLEAELARAVEAARAANPDLVVDPRRIVTNVAEIDRDSANHELGQQYWTQSDGTGRRWLAVQYEYPRRR